MDCVFCDRPLECHGCGEPYVPQGRAAYEALGRIEVAVTCPHCGRVLVCHWCRAPYDGVDDGDGDGDDWGD